jgi:hypothetical protein
MLRTTMNKDYFLELFDAAEAFGIEVEGHRQSKRLSALQSNQNRN